MGGDLKALKQLLRKQRGVVDVTADQTGFHVSVKTERVAQTLRARMPRYRGMAVTVSFTPEGPLSFLGSVVTTSKRDTGVVYEATRGVFHLVIGQCVGQTGFAPVLTIAQGRRRMVFRGATRKTLRRAVRDTERHAQAFGRAVRSALRPSKATAPVVPRCATTSSIVPAGSVSCR